MPSGLFYLKALFQEGVCTWFLLLPCFIAFPVLNANNADPDQMLHSAMSDQSLHCLPVSLLLKARYK